MSDGRFLVSTSDPDDRIDTTRIIVLSGPVAAGKSTLAASLAERYGADHLRTQHLLRRLAADQQEPLPAERRALQDYGDHLDTTTGGTWLSDAVAAYVSGSRPSSVIVDSVRRLDQIEALRRRFTRVDHIHVYAPVTVLDTRYRARSSSLTELPTYAEVAENATERAVGQLRGDAEVAIDTDRCDCGDVTIRAAAALRLLPSRSAQLVDVLVGGQYGSEGKGNIAYYLAPEYDLLMRVGGPNAGHKVPTRPPYTHRLLPSGTLANPTATLLIGPGATLDVALLLQEIADCGVRPGRLFVDPQAMIIEEEDLTREMSLVAGIGSTGKGGGAAAARRIMGRTPRSGVRLAGQVEEFKPYLCPSAQVLSEAYRSNQRIMLEGTQGTALSLYHGPYPHVTSRDTTTAGCLAEAGIAWSRVRDVVMVCRAYPIRVMSPVEGTSGPMKQEISWETVADRSGQPLASLISTERGSVSRNQRRVAEFDWELLREAAEVNGATSIALTFADYLSLANSDARRFDQLDANTILFIEEVERVGAAPVTLVGTRFDQRSIIDRRHR